MNHAKTAMEAIVRAGCTLDPALLGTLFAGERAEGYRHATADAAARLAAVETRETQARAEAERLRTGLRVMVRDFFEAWDDCTIVDARDMARAAQGLLGMDYNTERTWLPDDDPTLSATAPDAGQRHLMTKPHDGHRVDETCPACLPDAGQREAQERAYPAGHGWTPGHNKFGGGGCRVMLARYPCDYPEDAHDPALPPVDVDVFGYREGRRRADRSPEQP